MPAEPISNGPTVTELARRLQRIEDKLDERTATVDMLRSLERSVADRFLANEKLAEAREINHTASVQAVEYRVGRTEASNNRLTFMVIGAFLALLVQLIVIVVTASGGRGAG